MSTVNLLTRHNHFEVAFLAQLGQLQCAAVRVTQQDDNRRKKACKNEVNEDERC